MGQEEKLEEWEENYIKSIKWEIIGCVLGQKYLNAFLKCRCENTLPSQESTEEKRGITKINFSSR